MAQRLPHRDKCRTRTLVSCRACHFKPTQASVQTARPCAESSSELHLGDAAAGNRSPMKRAFLLELQKLLERQRFGDDDSRFLVVAHAVMRQVLDACGHVALEAFEPEEIASTHLAPGSD